MVIKGTTSWVMVVAVLGIAETSALAAPGDLLQTFLNPTPGVDDRFGWSVAAVGNKFLVGAYWDDTGATNSGAAYLFEIPEPSTP